MSWMQRLYETYEQATTQVGSTEDDKPIPVSHTVQNAHINITIDGQGNFLAARVQEEKPAIVLPATESSQGRSSGEAPHPLADKIQYVAGDYEDYGGLKSAYFKSYQKLLENWANSEFSHPSVQAVFSYIRKQAVIDDLVQHKILWVNNENKLLTKWDDNSSGAQPSIFKVLTSTGGKRDQGNALVCWTVEAENIECADTWKDESLHDCWKNYDEQHGNLSSVCYVSGKDEPMAFNHPAKLRFSGDKAKLISSNDLAGYTFRGRFTDTEATIKDNGLQGAVIGFNTSQKAHNALRWLIKRQGHWAREGDQVVIAWATSANSIIHPFEDVTMFDDPYDESAEEESTETGEELEVDNTPDHSKDIGYRYAKKLNRFMDGYRQEIETNETISVMAIDSASTGRMAVTYYRESMLEDYLDDIKAWHKDFSWPQSAKKLIQKNGRERSVTIWPIRAPNPSKILEGIYIDILKSNDLFKKQLYRRLLPCLLDRADVPQDILARAFGEASRFTNKKLWEWERSLGVACSLIKGHYIRHADQNCRRDYSMALDTTITSRDYLYGRLLALAERLEFIALQAAGANRPTTANRLMQRFADRPYSTWLTIYKQLDPYIRQLASSRAAFLTLILQEIDEVTSLFDHNDYLNDEALKGEFLLGFHCQRLALRNRSKSINENLESESGG